jgi:alkaline phosphatase
MIAASCSSAQAPVTSVSNSARLPKNIILLIGDGMGPQQLALADIYYQRTGDPRAASLARFVRSAAQGMHLPLPERSLVNDSACSASQLAGGCRCEPRQVGVDVRGARCSSAALLAQSIGMKVGLVSDTRITHATPAAFAAHVSDREMEHEIASQLLSSGIDLMLSGGKTFFVGSPDRCGDKRCASKAVMKQLRKDGRDLLQEAHQQGFHIVSSRQELVESTHTPLLGLFAPLHMHDAFREGEDGEPSLAFMATKALSLLENPNGFFLMVESGQIDTAAHYNDAGWVLREMLRLSEMVAVIDDFVRTRNDTLVILTADHETGGMGFSYRASADTDAPRGEGIDFLSKSSLQALRSQKGTIHGALGESVESEPSYQELEVVVKRMQQVTGEVFSKDELGEALVSRVDVAHADHHAQCDDIQSFYPYGTFRAAAMLGRKVGARHGVVWATGTHTSTAVSVMVKGPEAQRFVGWQQGHEVGEKLLRLIHERQAATR